MVCRSGVVTLCLVLTCCAEIRSKGMGGGLDVSVYLQNFGGDFITSDTAVRLARVLVESRYSKNVFQSDQRSRVTDGGDCWNVVFFNQVDSIPVLGTKFEELHISVKKSSGEFVKVVPS